jgi:predicted CXXCH cytochrome family protein
MVSGRHLRHGLYCVCVILGAGLLGVVLLNHSRSPTRDEQSIPAADAGIRRTTVDDADFIGSEACGVCHSQIWQSYRRHPMGRSLAAPLEAVPIENYDDSSFSPPGPRRYRVEVTADGVRHHESLADVDGAMLYDQAVEVSYALGSGKRGRAYLIEHDGMLFKSSIAWFSRQNAWGLAPDYLPDSHMRFERRITDGCINCHAGRMRVDREAPDRFVKPVFLETAIGCERCHGPGRKHVEAHETAPDRPLTQEFIVNPARLDFSRQNSICAQCHLHGESTVVRTGQRVYDFQPGQLLEENRIVFVTPAADVGSPGTQALSQVEQMFTSACYRKSGGRLSCTSCHDPHGVPAPEARTEFYRRKCLDCHESRGCGLPAVTRLEREPADSCIACHMPPALELRNVLHVSFADHRILRQPHGEPGAPEEDAPTTAELAVFDHADERLPKRELDRARGFMLVRGTEHKAYTTAGARRAERLLSAVHQAQPADIETLEALAAACLIQQRDAEGKAWCQKALVLDPRRESMLRQLGIFYHEDRQFVPARAYLERYLAVNAWHGSMHGRYAVVLALLGEWRACVAAARRGVELNPTLFQLHFLLANGYDQTGEPALGAQHRHLFEQMRDRLNGSGTAPEKVLSR